VINVVYCLLHNVDFSGSARAVGLLSWCVCDSYLTFEWNDLCISNSANSSRPNMERKVCRYNWHSAGSLGWPFSMLKQKYIFQIICGNNFICYGLKLPRCWLQFKKNKFIIIFYVIIFGTLSFLCVEVRSQNSQSGLRLGLGSLNARVVRRCATADELCRIKLKSGRRDL